MNKNLLALKVGILGGGQLARMLAIEGHKLGLEIHILSRFENDPAALVVRHWHQGDINNKADLVKFFVAMDVITVESEFLNEDLIRQVEVAAHKTLTPKIDTLATFADRLSQKSWLYEMKIPTAVFRGLKHQQDVEDFFSLNKKTGIVLKKRKFGYDGYGTYIIKSQDQLQQWLRENVSSLKDFIAEEFVPFRRELAIQFALNARGQVMVFPLVEWQAVAHKCLWVKGPMPHRQLSGFIKKVSTALKKSKYVGVIAFEIFETREGLIVNEVAPRVHNSGHHSIESLSLNQFVAHLLAVTGRSLVKAPEVYAGGFAMYNLIGSSTDNVGTATTHEDKIFSAEMIETPVNTHVHWYGKAENRPGRKMGHITALDKNPELALKRLLRARKHFKL